MAVLSRRLVSFVSRSPVKVVVLVSDANLPVTLCFVFSFIFLIGGGFFLLCFIFLSTSIFLLFYWFYSKSSCAIFYLLVLKSNSMFILFN